MCGLSVTKSHLCLFPCLFKTSFKNIIRDWAHWLDMPATVNVTTCMCLCVYVIVVQLTVNILYVGNQPGFTSYSVVKRRKRHFTASMKFLFIRNTELVKSDTVYKLSHFTKKKILMYCTILNITYYIYILIRTKILWTPNFCKVALVFPLQVRTDIPVHTEREDGANVSLLLRKRQGMTWYF